MMHRFILIFAIAWLTPALHAALAWSEEDQRFLALERDGKTLWRFNFVREEGKPYFHPLSSNTGQPLTWLRPADHTWHRGLWFSWKFINGVNYWEEKKGRSDGITELRSVSIEKGNDHSARFELTLAYHPHEQPDVLTETRMILVHAPDADGNLCVDWTLHFTAREKVEFNRTPPPTKGGPVWGGYAGLTYRAAKELNGLHALDSESRVSAAIHGQQARWMAYGGRLGTDPVAVVLFDHPQNPRQPTPWFVELREATETKPNYGFAGAAPLFDEPLVLEKDRTLTLRYRVRTVHGALDAAKLNEEARRFGTP